MGIMSMPTLSLVELSARGVRLEPHEAIAIAQQLIHSGAAAPRPDNVLLGADGSVTCVGCDATPGAYEMAIFLQTLLPFDRVGIPFGLRYAVARGLHEVEAPPFDSIDELAQALERFEKGDRRAVVRQLVRRATAVAPQIVPAASNAPRIAPAAPVVVSEPVTSALVVAAADDSRALTAPHVVEVPSRAPKSFRWSRVAAAAAIVFAIVSLTSLGVLFKSERGQTPQTVARMSAPATMNSPMPAASSTAPAVTPAAAPRSDASSRLAGASATRSAARVTTRRARASTRSRSTERVVQRRPRVLPAPESAAAVVEALDANRRPVFSPAFASNGSALFFHTGSTRDARSAIAVSDPTESGYGLEVMTIVDDGARNYHVQPSPDGRMIAFDSDRGGERAVYVARRDGMNVRRISGPGYAAVPTWSPDGRRIAYIRAESANPKVWNLWVQTLDDGRETRLTNYPYGQTWSASWFPDNQRICYSHEDKLVIVDLQAGRERVIESPVKGRLVRTPAVSPDGTKVIFQVYRQGAWMLNLRDDSLRFVLTDPTAEEFAWAPDGRRVAFHSRRNGQWGIYVMAG